MLSKIEKSHVFLLFIAVSLIFHISFGKSAQKNITSSSKTAAKKFESCGIRKFLENSSLRIREKYLKIFREIKFLQKKLAYEKKNMKYVYSVGEREKDCASMKKKKKVYDSYLPILPKSVCRNFHTAQEIAPGTRNEVSKTKAIKFAFYLLVADACIIFLFIVSPAFLYFSQRRHTMCGRFLFICTRTKGICTC